MHARTNISVYLHQTTKAVLTSSFSKNEPIICVLANNSSSTVCVAVLFQGELPHAVSGPMLYFNRICSGF